MADKNSYGTSRFSTLQTIKISQMEIVEDRGYTIPPEEREYFKMSTEQFEHKLTELSKQYQLQPRCMLNQVYNSASVTHKKRLLVYYTNKSGSQKQISASIVRDFISKILEWKVDDAILIVDAPVSPTGMDELSALTIPKWQIFNDNELGYNPIDHTYGSKHILLSKEEARAKLRELKSNIDNIPLASLNDPIIKHYGWQVGDIIKIIREDDVNQLTTHNLNYRLVIG